MDKIKKTNQEIIEFCNVSQRWLEQQEKESKFRYAVMRTNKSASRVVGKFSDEENTINIKHCLAAEDGKGEILREQSGNLKYTKAGLLARNDERRQLLNKNVEVEVHFAEQADIPNDLPPLVRDIFTGFVIRESAVVRPKEEKAPK